MGNRCFILKSELKLYTLYSKEGHFSCIREEYLQLHHVIIFLKKYQKKK